MDIKQLRYFDEVVKHGKVSWAANSLYISQPSLSMSLNKLEKEVGFKLLERSDGVFKLTDAGTEFHKHVELILSIYSNMEDEVEYIGKEGVGQLKLGITELFRAVVPELFDMFLELNYDFDIKLIEGKTAHIVNQLRLHQVHFALTPLSYLDDDMESIFLSENHYSLLVHRDFPENSIEPVNMDTLQESTLIYREDSYELDKFLRNNELNFRNIIKVDTIGTAVRLVKKGLGISIIPKIYAMNYTDDDVKALDMNFDLRGPDLYLSYMKERHFTPIIDECIIITKNYLMM